MVSLSNLFASHLIHPTHHWLFFIHDSKLVMLPSALLAHGLLLLAFGLLPGFLHVQDLTLIQAVIVLPVCVCVCVCVSDASQRKIRTAENGVGGHIGWAWELPGSRLGSREEVSVPGCHLSGQVVLALLPVPAQVFGLAVGCFD
eukprot:1097163-Pelagomonas_calceolata.AAC.1